ncbi:MAG: DUF1592 domain-containing protein [Verrucomicrobiales bacterium]|nr:DUF1592 domain-containing protein [Verrucomicrobiales bacterium]
MKPVIAVLLSGFILTLSLSSRGEEVTVPADFDPFDFLSAYCLDCHDDLTQKGDRRLDDLPLDPGVDILTAERWEEVMHQLQLGEMPPAKKDQPSEEEHLVMISWVRDMLSEVRRKTESQGARVTMRRLNQEEYRYTVRDLFSFTEGDFDPSRHFPADNEVEGFLNNGAALRTSSQLLEQYLRAADEIIDYAYELVQPRSSAWPQTWQVDPEGDGAILFANGIQLAKGEDGTKTVAFSSGLRSHDATYGAKLMIEGLAGRGAPISGWYDFTVDVEARNRKHRYGDELNYDYHGRIFRDLTDFYDSNQPMQLGIGRQFGRSAAERARIKPNLVAIHELPDETPITLTSRIWLDTGSHPYLSFVNGPPRGTKMQFVTNRLHRFDESVPAINPEVRADLTKRAKRNAKYNDRYQGPEIHLSKATVVGPLPPTEKHPAHDLLFREIEPSRSRVNPDLLRRELVRIASTFFRSPQTAEDIEIYAEMIESTISLENRYRDALRPVLKTFLCSPKFLFLHEPVEPGKESLSPQEVSNRLSYFLTSSLPDPQLTERLTRSKLNPGSLRREARALLAKEKGERFFLHFTDQWLGLNKLGTMPPGTGEFPGYYLDELEDVGKEETRRFFAALVRENRPVTQLADADFTFVNPALARHYELPPLTGSEWERVYLPADSPRRGLLGQASVLTVTSNGVDTSPVIRGVWMLEKIFGTPPAPAPPDVPPIEPDIRGAKTIRELLGKHREVNACAVCHDRIDPLGYVFETFDPIGGLRTVYENGTEIDTSGQYRGEEIEKVADVRRFLVNHPELLTHNLAEKMLTYALGRELEFQDSDDLEQIIERWKKEGLGLRTLIELVVISDPFLSF